MLPAQQFGAAHTGGLAGAGSTSFRGCRGLTGCGLRCIPERLCPAPVATGAVVSRGAVGCRDPCTTPKIQNAGLLVTHQGNWG